MRIRQHVNPLKSNFFDIPIAPLAFPPGVPVEVELGSAEAWFLMDRARAEPNGFYVGVELRREHVLAANIEVEKAGLPQVKSLFANLSVDLRRIFPAGSVRRFFFYFPDPFFKAVQHKRRAMSAEVVADIHALLAPDGELHMATDIFDLALETMALLEMSPQPFEGLAGPWTFLKESPVSARSRRELQCEKDGTRIWRLGYRRG